MGCSARAPAVRDPSPTQHLVGSRIRLPCARRISAFRQTPRDDAHARHPTFANWDQDKTAVDDRYDLQDPVVVRREIVFAGDQLADRFDSVADAEWGRKGLRSDGATFTIDTFGRYLLHDPIHHLWDVAH